MARLTPSISASSKRIQRQRKFFDLRAVIQASLQISPHQISPHLFPPLLCQTSGTCSSLIIKYPSISTAKGRKHGSMKENSTAISEDNLGLENRIVGNASEHPQSPSDTPEWHKGTLIPVPFSVLFF